jgi:hypothetical protein
VALRPFKKGQSGNPGGRPKIPADVKELARGLSVDAIKTLAAVMRDTKQSGPARVSAASTILDRGYGKAPQHITTERLDSLSNEQIAHELAEALRELGINASGIDFGGRPEDEDRERKGATVVH